MKWQGWIPGSPMWHWVLQVDFRHSNSVILITSLHLELAQPHDKMATRLRRAGMPLEWRVRRTVSQVTRGDCGDRGLDYVHAAEAASDAGGVYVCG